MGEEKEEEIEIKAKAATVLQQVIQEECKKLDDADGVLKTAQQTTAEEEMQASGDVPMKTDEQVAEVKASSGDAPLKNDENTENTSCDDAPVQNDETAETPCTQGKASGKTSMMGGTRGFSFMKRMYRSSTRTTQAAKAGA